MNNETKKSKQTIQNIDELLEAMWLDYTEINPQAKKIHELFASRGETVVNDHIALRTFNLPPINIDVLARSFVQFGYRQRGNYEFPDKRLVAKHYEADSRPKVFISELQVEKFDNSFQKIVKDMVDALDNSITDRFDLCIAHRPWDLSFDTYQKLRKSSEYAAWVAALGFRPNHFTVLVNALKTFDTLQAVNDFLEGEGFLLNEAGGKIKGNPALLLEQSSVLAGNVQVGFSDGLRTVPGCYYEFAQRYESEPGNLYQGFIAQSANRIFESTDRGQ